MANIKNIIFDFGNVIFDIDMPSIERELRAAAGAGFEAGRAKLLKNNVFDLYETGGLTTEEFVDAIRFAVEPPLTEAQVVAAWNSIFRQLPAHRLEMLLRLRQRFNVFLLSNINDLHERWINDYLRREHGITDFETRYFDAVYYSHLVRLRKPGREIFEYVLADADLVPAETLFFDDLPDNVAAAKQLGISAILHPVGTEITAVIGQYLPN
jgi:glucose-1-phosphatase